MLEYLATHPIGIEGLVDVEKGKIYRKASSRWVRVATLLAPPAVLLAGVGLAWILTSLDDWGLVGSDWPDGLDTFGPVLSAYVFVTAGALAHVAVSFLKRSRESGGEPLVVAGFFWWLHVRWASVSLSVLWLWIAVLGLAIVDQLVAHGVPRRLRDRQRRRPLPPALRGPRLEGRRVAQEGLLLAASRLRRRKRPRPGSSLGARGGSSPITDRETLSQRVEARPAQRHTCVWIELVMSV